MRFVSAPTKILTITKYLCAWLLPLVLTSGLSGQVCLPSVKSKCVSDCSLRCGIVGACIFGCELGGINNLDQCRVNCGADTVCLQGCFSTLSCIAAGCSGGIQVKYFSNLHLADSFVNLVNTGANGAPLNGPGFGPAGNICANVYAFSPDEQLVSCCSCLITPNGLVSLSVRDDLRANTLTGTAPDSMVVKLLTTATGPGPTFTGTVCAGSAAAAGTDAFPLLQERVAAWGTTAHFAGAGAVPAAPAPFSITETPFIFAALSPGELASITNRCTNIVGNGSGFGICRACSQGGRGGSRQ